MTPTPIEPSEEPREYGVNPTPAALIEVQDDELAEEIGALFPVWRRVESWNVAAEHEWDVLVTTDKMYTSSMVGSDYGYSPHLFAMAFGHMHYGRAATADGSNVATVAAHSGSCSSEDRLRVPSDLPAGVADLVQRDLIPQAQARDQHVIVTATLEPVDFATFLETGQGRPIAARFRRNHAVAECWALPPDVKLHAEWVRAALRHWREIAPERFQQIPGWERQREWLTVEESQIDRELVEVRDELAEITVRLQQERERLTARLTEARIRAERGLRRLLTANDDELVDAVAAALSRLGFDVIDVDEEIAEKGDRVEDLRVTDPDVDGWIALVEVKGTTGGAPSSGLQQIWKDVIRYVRAGHPEPDAVWYVVNQFRGQDPRVRPAIFTSKEDELDAFAEGGGLAIDTAELFRLVRLVEDNELEHVEARRRLRETTGRFEVDGEPTAI